jgi:hypothetical protein
MSDTSTPANAGAKNGNGKPRRLFRRGPWENASTVVIGVGIVMLMQPFAMALFSYSFTVILVGAIGFVITSHFPE